MLSWGGDDTQRVQVVSPSIKLSKFELTRPQVYGSVYVKQLKIWMSTTKKLKANIGLKQRILLRKQLSQDESKC